MEGTFINNNVAFSSLYSLVIIVVRSDEKGAGYSRFNLFLCLNLQYNSACGIFECSNVTSLGKGVL